MSNSKKIINQKILILSKRIPNESGVWRKEDLFVTSSKKLLEISKDSIIVSTQINKNHKFKIKNIINILNLNILFWPHYLRNLSILAKIDNQIDGKKIDKVIALNSTIPTGIIAYYLKRVYKIPYLIWEHISFYRFFHLNFIKVYQVKKIIHESQSVIAVSPQLKKDITAFTNSKKEVSVIKNVLPDYFFSKPKNSIKLFEKKGFIFAAWTNWRHFKRLDIILKSFDIISQDFDDVFLVIAGPIPYYAQAYVREKKLENRVTFLGNVGREAVHNLAYKCNCNLVSSDVETFGLPIIESLSQGKPSISTKCGGPESIIIDKKYGILVDKNDIHEFADAMSTVYLNYKYYDKMVIKEYAIKNFSTKIFQDSWYPILNK